MKTKIKKQYSDNRLGVLILNYCNLQQSAGEQQVQLVVNSDFKTSFKAISKCFLYIVHFIFNISICLSFISIRRPV